MNAQWSLDGSGNGGGKLGVRVVPGVGHVVVSLTGEIDLSTEQALREALMWEVAESARRRLVVDLAGVEYMASAGLHVLLTVNKLVKTAGGSLVLACAQPVVARVLSMTGVDELIPVAGDVQEALALG